MVCVFHRSRRLPPVRNLADILLWNCLFTLISVLLSTYAFGLLLWDEKCWATLGHRNRCLYMKTFDFEASVLSVNLNYWPKYRYYGVLINTSIRSLNQLCSVSQRWRRYEEMEHSVTRFQRECLSVHKHHAAATKIDTVRYVIMFLVRWCFFLSSWAVRSATAEVVWFGWRRHFRTKPSRWVHCSIMKAAPRCLSYDHKPSILSPSSAAVAHLLQMDSNVFQARRFCTLFDATSRRVISYSIVVQTPSSVPNGGR